jgi:DNA-binding NarL/FixJ family response regulator
LGTQLWPSNRPDYERWAARARARLDPGDFGRALAEGRAMPLEEAAAWALELGGAASLASRPADRALLLTPREREVAQLAARGFTNQQIARALVITEKTAANHMQRILDKVGLNSRTHLAARAAEFGLEPAGAADAQP